MTPAICSTFRIRCGNDDVFGHISFAVQAMSFLKPLVVFADAVIINAGSQKIDIVRDMRFDLLVEQIRIGNDAGELIFFH